MSNDYKKVMQMALDALDSDNPDIQLRAATHLRAALAQPEQEPVAWMERERAVGYREGHQAALKQREWQGLTDEDRQGIERWIEFKEAGGNEPVPTQKLITYIESKLREKNT